MTAPTRRAASSTTGKPETSATATNAAGVTATAFDPSRAYALHPQLALRPERFGALDRKSVV